VSYTATEVTSRVAKKLAGRGQRLDAAQLTALRKQVELHILIARELEAAKAEHEQRVHDEAMEEVYGPYGQG
jgi:hypothetical protein